MFIWQIMVCRAREICETLGSVNEKVNKFLDVVHSSLSQRDMLKSHWRHYMFSDRRTCKTFVLKMLSSGQMRYVKSQKRYIYFLIIGTPLRCFIASNEVEILLQNLYSVIRYSWMKEIMKSFLVCCHDKGNFMLTGGGNLLFNLWWREVREPVCRLSFVTSVYF